MATEMDILVRARDEATGVFRRVSSAATQTSSRFSRLGAAMATWGKRAALGVGVAGAAVGAGLKSAIDSASDLNESLSKVGVVFGKNAKDMVAWSRTAATAMGQSQQQALEAAGTFGNLFRANQIAGEEASNMSKTMVQLAADLASFNNADPSEVLVNLRSGLVGEAEPLRKFGVSLSAARIEEQALRMGLAKQGEELSAAAKMQAAYAVILEDTKLAQGDFARTADGVANRQRTVAAQFEDLKAKVGQIFLPVWQTMLGWFQRGMQAFQGALPTIVAVGRSLWEGLVNAFNAVRDALVNVWNTIGPFVTALAKDMWGSIQKVWGVLRRNLIPSILNLWQAFKPVLAVVGALVGVALAGLLKALPIVARLLAAQINVLARVVGAVKDLGVWIGRAVVWLKDRFVGAWNAVKDTATGIWDGIYGAAKRVFNAIASAWNNTVGKLSFRAPDWVPLIGGKGFDVPDIPLLGEGGIVTRPTLAVVGESGPEAVIPLSKRTGLGGNLRVAVTIDRRRWVREHDYEIAYGGV